MLCVNFQGGLGNQLFIYSFCYALSRKFNQEVILDDTLYLRNNIFKLDLFDIEIKKKLYSRKPYNYFLCKLFLVRYIFDKKIKFKQHIHHKCVNSMSDFMEINITADDVFFTGFWQNPKFFNEYRYDITRQLILKNPSEQLIAVEEKIRCSSYCAIHIRRGDYAQFNGGSILPMTYYDKAIEIMQRTGVDQKFLVFSDDLEFCKEYFKDYPNIDFIDQFGDFTDAEELEIMSKCSSFIIANSSYSWWGAYLSESSNVICPYYRGWREEFYCSEWTPIEVDSI